MPVVLQFNNLLGFDGIGKFPNKAIGCRWIVSLPATESAL
jgi:hypothetical protein